MPVKPHYRPEIQGIRALNALLIAAFHIWFDRVSGGVDVFFVLSGYFLALNVIHAHNNNISFKPLNHIKKFILRTLPEIVLVLSVVFVGIFLTYFLMDWRMLLRNISFSALYLENFYLMAMATQYLDRATNLNPLLHFWAVSIIGQVYFSWVIVEKLTHLFKRFTIQTALAAIIIPLGLASFLWGLWYTEKYPAMAYFDILSRYWEFCFGALLAIIHSKRHWYIPYLDLIGLVLLISCGAVAGKSFNFPGWIALWPLIAIALILVFADDNRSIVRRLLGHSWLVGLGELGFGIYLWHWPLYAFYWQFYHGAPTLLHGVLIILLATVLALYSRKFALKFKPSSDRNAPKQGVSRRHGVKTVLSMLMGLFVVNAAAGVLLKKYESPLKEAYLAYMQKKMHMEKLVVTPSYESTATATGCQLPTYGTDTHTCVFNPKGSGGVLHAIGSSHISQWVPALQRFAMEKNLKLLVSTKSGCNLGFFDDGSDCDIWGHKMVKEAIARRDNYVFATGTAVKFDPNGYTARQTATSESIPPAFSRAFKQLNDHGIRVVAIRDTPRMGFNIPECTLSQLRQKDPCWRKREDVLPGHIDFSHLPPKTHFMDMDSAVCSNSRCSAIINHRLAFSDSHHVTIGLVKSVQKAFDQGIESAL